MRPFIDPRLAFRGGSEIQSLWLDSWREATGWWLNPPLSGGASAPSERLLAEIVEGLRSRFERSRVEFGLAGHRLQAELDWIRLRRQAAGYEARLDLLDVHYAGWVIEELSAVISGIALELEPVAQITLSGIEIQGRARSEPVIRRLNTDRPAWSLSLNAGDRIRARARRSSLTIVVDPEVVEHELQMEVRAVGFGSLQLPLPRWLRIARARPLPQLPRAIRIEQATQRAGFVAFRATIPRLTERFDLRGLRDAILGEAARSRGGLTPRRRARRGCRASVRSGDRLMATSRQRVAGGVGEGDDRDRPALETRPEDHPPTASAFPLIADYAFLSDCETVALIAPSGDVEWMCLPRPDSPSVFGSILDRGAGTFRVGPADALVPAARRYLPGTMVLETTWMTRAGWLIVRDSLLIGPWYHEHERSKRHRRAPTDQDADHVLVRNGSLRPRLRRSTAGL